MRKRSYLTDHGYDFGCDVSIVIMHCAVHLVKRKQMQPHMNLGTETIYLFIVVHFRDFLTTKLVHERNRLLRDAGGTWRTWKSPCDTPSRDGWEPQLCLGDLVARWYSRASSCYIAVTDKIREWYNFCKLNLWDASDRFCWKIKIMSSHHFFPELFAVKRNILSRFSDWIFWRVENYRISRHCMLFIEKSNIFDLLILSAVWPIRVTGNYWMRHSLQRSIALLSPIPSLFDVSKKRFPNSDLPHETQNYLLLSLNFNDFIFQVKHLTGAVRHYWI